MKLLAPLLLFIFLSTLLKAQYTVETDYIKARSESNGILFFNSETVMPAFETPIGSLNCTIFAFDFWISGKNDAIVYADGTRFLQIVDSSSADRFGPMMNPIYYATEDDIWNRIWNINREQIDYHIQSYSQSSYVMPEVIENWPAHGDPSKGQAYYLAPFFDENNNGVYDPENGDYPSIIGDHAIFSMYNGERCNEYKDPMGIEAHVMVYTYDCDEEAYQNTIFSYVKYYNRSNLDYDSTFVGFFTDFDIGNPIDDFGLTDVNRSTVYACNSDTLDNTNLNGNGYGYVIPVQSATILRGVKQDDDLIDNYFGIGEGETINGFGFGDGIADNEYKGLDYSILVYQAVGPAACQDPNSATEFYRLMTAFWKDGTPLTYGGIGFDLDSNLQKSRFIFCENDPSNYATDGNAFSSEWEDIPGADIRMIGSSGPVTFGAGESRDMYMAFVHAQVGMSKDSSIALMKEYIDILQNDFDNGFNPCGSLVLYVNENQNNSNKELNAYPNPFTDQIRFTYEGNDINAKVFIYDLLGHEQFQSSVQNGSNELNLNELEGNAFIIKLIDKDGSYTQKVMKN